MASDLNHTQIADGQEFTLNTLNLWVDAELYVPLRMQMEGVARQGNESRPLTIEREDKDYRAVPGCGSLYEPFQTVMRIAGVMTPEQEAQMRDAQAQMAQMEEQMRQMPAAQREMIMARMGPQMEMMRSMASGGGVAIESRVVEMRCNAPVPSATEMAQAFGLGVANGQ